MSGELAGVLADARALYAAGHAFDAHELLEDAWHARGRVGAEATLLKALIKLCAARVKLADGNAKGVESHTAGACALVDELERTGAAEVAGATRAAVRAEAAAIRAGSPTARPW